MAKLTTAERLNQIRDDLNIKGKKFNSSSNKKKKKKKIQSRFTLKKKELKKTFNEDYVRYLLSLDESDAIKELENVELIFMEPSALERHERHIYENKKYREKRKAYQKYLDEKNPKSFSDIDKIEKKFDRSVKKIQKKYNKKGFDLYNDKVIKVDPDDLIKRLKKVRKENESINDKFLSFMDELYDGGDLPDIITAVDEKNSRIDKTTRKLIKSLEKVSLSGVRI